MHILMIGWEFPPVIRGGLGFATYAIAKGLAQKGVRVTLILPFDPGIHVEGVRIIPLGEKKPVGILYHAYHTLTSYRRAWQRLPRKLRAGYHADLIAETDQYAQRLITWLQDEGASMHAEDPFTLIHAHDWLTLSAGCAAREVLGLPLVVHVHATEYDRHGGQLHDTLIAQREAIGFAQADLLIAVSDYTRRILIREYHIPSEKIHVAYNGADHLTLARGIPQLGAERKIILFAGRLTIQKGPLQFIRAAARALNEVPDALIIIAGSGELWDEIIDEARRLGIADRLIMTGFLKQDELSRLYATAHVVVMPSVSEPFGLTAVEAALHGAPVIVSKQSGVAEVLPTLTVDFWDEEKLAHYLIMLLTHSPLREAFREHLPHIAKRVTWAQTAESILSAYHTLHTDVLHS